MIKVRKYNYGSGAVKKKFDLSSKERSRASEDGVAIITRQQRLGTYGVFAIDINTGFPVGDNWYEADTQSEIPKAITSLNRDLDKFYGRGGEMSDRGRMRLKEAIINPRKAFEQALEKTGGAQSSLTSLAGLVRDLENRTKIVIAAANKANEDFQRYLLYSPLHEDENLYYMSRNLPYKLGDTRIVLFQMEQDIKKLIKAIE